MRRKNYIFAAVATLMWTACSNNEEAPSQDAWADEGIEVEAFPNYEGEDADTRATICARPKTAWESPDVLGS
jgi:outer membrane biogenesis lipoprotein LolB